MKFQVKIDRIKKNKFVKRPILSKSIWKSIKAYIYCLCGTHQLTRGATFQICGQWGRWELSLLGLRPYIRSLLSLVIMINTKPHKVISSGIQSNNLRVVNPPLNCSDIWSLQFLKIFKLRFTGWWMHQLNFWTLTRISRKWLENRIFKVFSRGGQIVDGIPEVASLEFFRYLLEKPLMPLLLISLLKKNSFQKLYNTIAKLCITCEIFFTIETIHMSSRTLIDLNFVLILVDVSTKIKHSFCLFFWLLNYNLKLKSSAWSGFAYAGFLWVYGVYTCRRWNCPR